MRSATVLGIQRVLRAQKYDSEIFVETADYPTGTSDARLPGARRLAIPIIC
jgi:hypothetical protein